MRRDDLGQAVLGLLDDLYRFARSLEDTSTDVEDLVQESLARALDHALELRHPSALRKWLFRLMRRLHLDRRRCERYRGRLAVLKGGLDELALFSIGDLDDEVIVRDDAALVYRALLHLPEDQRAALVLVNVWECSYEETARIVGVPIGTVRSRVARARARLEEAGARSHADVQDETGSASRRRKGTPQPTSAFCERLRTDQAVRQSV
jgi:RNA polymerase sigma-70 factor (ECF subfamily)